MDGGNQCTIARNMGSQPTHSWPLAELAADLMPRQRMLCDVVRSKFGDKEHRVRCAHREAERVGVPRACLHGCRKSIVHAKYGGDEMSTGYCLLETPYFLGSSEPSATPLMLRWPVP